MQIEHEGLSYDTRVFTPADLAASGLPSEQVDRARRAEATISIDEAAGHARARFVSPGALVAEEYRAARDAVQRWREAGSPADGVPPEIVSGADYSDVSHEQAAVEIEQTAQAFEQALAAIRAARLPGKRAVSDASGDDIDAAAEAAIAQLEAIRPPAPVNPE